MRVDAKQMRRTEIYFHTDEPMGICVYVCCGLNPFSVNLLFLEKIF